MQVNIFSSHVFLGCLVDWVFFLSVMTKAILNVTVACCACSTELAKDGAVLASAKDTDAD